MEISADKITSTTNNTSGVSTEIKVNGQKPETVTSFKYLGSAITDKGSKPKIFSRMAQTTAALKRLKPVWKGRSISLGCKIRLPHLSSCMLVNRGLLQQSCTEGNEQWK